MFRILIIVSLLVMLPVMASAACGGGMGDVKEGSTCAFPAGNTGGGCDKGCAEPCACTQWNQYCGCEMLTGLCISLETTCDGGTAGPLMLLLRDTDFNDIVTIELAGPIDGYYTMNYEFETPVRADSLQEAVIINKTDDSATLAKFSVYGMFGPCGGGWSYFDFTCTGAVIGADGCPRMVLF